jgi:hypothetical protein
MLFWTFGCALTVSDIGLNNLSEVLHRRLQGSIYGPGLMGYRKVDPSLLMSTTCAQLTLMVPPHCLAHYIIWQYVYKDNNVFYCFFSFA